jgi:hypothetical protein
LKKANAKTADKGNSVTQSFKELGTNNVAEEIVGVKSQDRRSHENVGETNAKVMETAACVEQCEFGGCLGFEELD